MTSIGNSRASIFLKYFPNNAEYASKVRRPLSAPVHKMKRKTINKRWKRQVEPKSKDEDTNMESVSFVANSQVVQFAVDTQTEIPYTLHQAVQTETDLLGFKQTSVSSHPGDKALGEVHRKRSTKRSKRKANAKTKDHGTITESVPYVENVQVVQITVYTQTEIPYTLPQAVQTDKDILNIKESNFSSNTDVMALVYKDSRAEPGPLSSTSSSQIEDTSTNLDNLSELLQKIKSIGEPRLILSLHGSYDEDWLDQECLKNVLDNIVNSAGRCGLIYQPKIPFLQKLKHTDLTEGVVYGYRKVNYKTKENKAKEEEEQKTGEEEEEEQKTGEEEEEVEQKTEGEEEENQKTGDDEIAESVYNEKRLMIECYFNKHMKTAIQNIEARVPVVLLLSKGDLTELEHVARALNVDISVVLLKGSGGAADLISLCMEDLSNIKTASPVLLERRLNKECENLEKVMRAIIEKKWLVSVCDLKVDSCENLWKKITNGIMRAWSFESDEDLKDDRMYRHRLLFEAQGPLFNRNVISISQHVAKQEMSSSELFGRYSLQEKDKTQIQYDLYTALSSNDSSKTRRLLTRFKIISLNMQYLKSLYMEEARKNTSISFRICQRICPDECRFLTKNNSTSSKEFNSPKEAANTIANKLLKGMWFSKIAYCKESQKNDEESNLEDILLKHIIMSNVDMARVLWVKSQNAITTALFSSCVLRALALKADEFFEESQDIYDHSNRFAKRAEILLDMLFQYDEDIATEALEHVTNVWGHNDSPLHFGKKFGMEDFISHSSTQKEANKRLYCYSTEKKEQTSNSTKHNITKTPDGLAPDCISFIRHHGNKKNIWKSVTAPITRIVIQFVVFLSCLAMFSVFLLTDLNFTVVSSLEIVVCVIMVGDFLEEMLNMLRCNDNSRWSPQNILLHLIDIWNFMDLLCFVLYFTAFGIHLTGSEDMIIHIRRLYSVALFIMFLRILNIFLMIRKFGIIVIMVHEMLVDLVKYLVILLVFILAAGVVYHANLYPNHTITTAFPNNIGYWRIWKLLKVPYWQVYGELNLDTLEGSDQLCTNNITLWSTDPFVERCPEGDWITTVIAAFYMMLTNWLWLNTVIAMFSSRYVKVKEQAEQKWRYHRHSVVINYEHWIPSPLNLIFRPILVFYKLTKCYRTPEQLTCCQCSRTPEQSTCCKCYSKPKMSTKLVNMQKQFAQKIIEDEMNASSTPLHL